MRTPIKIEVDLEDIMPYSYVMLIKKALIALFTLVIITGALFAYIKSQEKTANDNLNLLTPINESPFETQLKALREKEGQADVLDDNILSLLLLGIDRRSKAELSFRTDTMVLILANPDKNKAVLISVPRDLWYDGNRVNAVYTLYGWEELQKAFEQVSGIKPNKYILTDFEDFSWVVDAMGGVPVDVETSFVDSSYPVDATKTYQTVTFEAGREVLTGERALIYSRSRKGTNGEGSDWARMRRQHLILKGMLEAVTQPESLFNPMVIENAFNTVTSGRMDTNLTVKEAGFLWDLYKDWNKYEFTSLFLDSHYLYNPPMEDYGGAWVMVPLDTGYSTFKQDVLKALYGLEINAPTYENQPSAF